MNDKKRMIKINKSDWPQFKAKKEQTDPTAYDILAGLYNQAESHTGRTADARGHMPPVVYRDRETHAVVFDSAYPRPDIPDYYNVLLKDSHFMGYAYYAALYQNGIISSIVDILVNDMLRSGFDLVNTADPEHLDAVQMKIDYIRLRFKELSLNKMLRKAVKNTFIFGGCFIFPELYGDANSEQLQNELFLTPDILNRERRITHLQVIEPNYCYYLDFNADNPLSRDFYNPERYTIISKTVHRTRLIKVTHLLPPTLYLPIYNFFGVPLIQQLEEYVRRFEKMNDDIMGIINSMRTTILKTNTSKIRNGDPSNIIKNGRTMQQRVKMYNIQKNNFGTVVIDKETEEIQEINTTLAGLSDLLTSFMDQISVVPHIPNTQIWGTAPKGLNATGEFDMNNYYNTIESLQENILTDVVIRLVNLLCYEYNGTDSRDIEVRWNPLKSKNELESSQIKTSLLNDIKNMVETGILNISEARDYIAKSSILDFELDADFGSETEDETDLDNELINEINAIAEMPDEQTDLS